MLKKWLGRGALLFAVIAIAAGGWFWYRERELTRFGAEPHLVSQLATVDIPAGSSPRRIANLLEGAGVVTHADRFYRYVRREGLAPKLKAGEYVFHGQVTPAEVARKIVDGEVKMYRVTVREGLRVDEVLPLLAKSELALDEQKLKALVADPGFRAELKVPADSLEGFLFPDTYAFTRAADERAVLSKMVLRAMEEYRRADAQRAPGITLDPLQTFTLASIVEKETGAREERPRISCVFHNRLRLGMKLQTDPTVLYAMSLLRGSWVNNITRKDLQTVHPYNTYTTAGLPPGPIANPGAEALKAALNPIRCDDLYFVSRNDGTHIFCPDLACHEAAVEEWQRAYFRKKRAAEGRKSVGGAASPKAR